MSRLIVAALVAGVLGGCLAPSGPSADDATESVEPRLEGNAVLEGWVLSEDELPLPGANVTIPDLGVAASSDEAGWFELANLAPGSWTVFAELAGFEADEQVVELAQDARTRVDLRLLPLPSTGSFNRTLIFQGHYDCAHEIPIWTGDCMILYEAATNQSDPYTNETYHFRLPVEAGWESVLLELVWQGGANNQLEGMRLYLENGNGTDVGHSYKVGRADGDENPLRVLVNRTEPHPRADVYPGTQTKAFIPDEGEVAQIRVFPRGRLADEMSQFCDGDGRCFLGWGAGIGIDFTVYATVFYHARAPAGFTALPDA